MWSLERELFVLERPEIRQYLGTFGSHDHEGDHCHLLLIRGVVMIMMMVGALVEKRLGP